LKGLSLSAARAAHILRRRIIDLDAKLIFLTYSVLQWVASPLLILYFFVRFLTNPRYLRRFPERLGFLPHSLRRQAAGAIWLHAVSVGEVLSAAPLLRRLKVEASGEPLFVSTSTLAGRALADERLAGIADGVFFAPLDFRFAVRRVLRTIQPAVVVVMETEIWPHLYRESRRSGARLLVVNGRISDKAMGKYRRLSWFFRAVLALPDRILAQDPISLERYLALGAPPERAIDAGNLKYDFSPRQTTVPAEIREFLERAGPESIWIAASTMPPVQDGDVDEDDAVLEAFREVARTNPQLLLILVPRKPERFETAAVKLEASGIPWARRSQLKLGARLAKLPGVLLLDSIGEMAALFGLDSVVLMGGTLANRGGHNILEPAAFGRAVICGPHMENFPEIMQSFRASTACEEIASAAELGNAVNRLLGDRALRQELGNKARIVADSKRGTTDRALRTILDLREEALPRRRPPLPVFQVLWAMSRAWQGGSAWEQRRNRSRRQRLATPVVSVGGLSMGGSGKTPLVLWLARELRRTGLRPAILTRGYRRRVPESRTILEAGAHVPVARTGDEAQMFLRARVAPVGIGADRLATGREMETRFHPDVMILDDGFQHRRIDRDLDIVLIDGLDPFGGGDVFPLGRLRETPGELGRADVLVITRASHGRSYLGIERELRRHNRRAPIFKAGIEPECWVDCASGETFQPEMLPFRKVSAFCGLANPTSFWSTLTLLGCRPLGRRNLSDHHRYKPRELRRLAAEAQACGSEAILTTEKDFMNLFEGAAQVVSPLHLLYLRIGLKIEGGEQLLALVREAIVKAGLQRQ
jgi:tetraacyldisaccharide 4'-kinase